MTVWEKVREFFGRPRAWAGAAAAGPRCPEFSTMAALGSGMPRRGFTYLGRGWGVWDMWADESNRIVYGVRHDDGSITLRLEWRGRVRSTCVVRTPEHVRLFLDKL